MSLPRVVLATAEVTIGDDTVVVRSLSRSEAVRLTNDFAGDPDRAEDFVLACGVGVSQDEARAWREAAPVDDGGALVEAILQVSGLTEGASKSG